MLQCKKNISIVVFLTLIILSSFPKDIYASTDVQEIIGYTQTRLIGGEIDNVIVSRVKETNLGDLVADAVADATKEILKGTKYQNMPIVGLQNGGGIRKTIFEGPITRKQINDTLPYGNFLVVYDITPKVLYEILENGVSRIKVDKRGNIIGIDGRFLQISGINVIYDYSQPSTEIVDNSMVTGSRVLAVYLDGSEESLDREDTSSHIILGFNNYCMDGGDGYFMLKSEEVICKGDTLNNIVCNYIQDICKFNGGVVNYTTNNRINIGQSTLKGKKSDEIKLLFNSELLILYVPPIIDNYKLLVPLRTISEVLGAEIAWDEYRREVTVISNGHTIKININTNAVLVDEKMINTDYPVRLIEDYTMVSVDFLEDILNINANWDCKYNTLSIEN